MKALLALLVFLAHQSLSITLVFATNQQVVANSGHIGCKNKEAKQKLTSFAVAGDREAEEIEALPPGLQARLLRSRMFDRPTF